MNLIFTVQKDAANYNKLNVLIGIADVVINIIVSLFILREHDSPLNIDLQRY